MLVSHNVLYSEIISYKAVSFAVNVIVTIALIAAVVVIAWAPDSKKMLVGKERKPRKQLYFTVQLYFFSFC